MSEQREFFRVPVRFVFSGTVDVRADDAGAAKKAVEDSVSLVMGGSIHAALPDDDVDWDFDQHADQEVGDPTLRSLVEHTVFEEIHHSPTDQPNAN